MTLNYATYTALHYITVHYATLQYITLYAVITSLQVQLQLAYDVSKINHNMAWSEKSKSHGQSSCSQLVEPCLVPYF